MINYEKIKIPVPVQTNIDFINKTGIELPSEIELEIEFNSEFKTYRISQVNNNFVIKNNVIMLENGFVNEDSLKYG